MDIKNKIPKGYFLTEFDLVNNTASPISYDLFNVNTLNVFETQQQQNVLPNIVTGTLTGTNPLGIKYCPTNNSMYLLNVLDSTISVLSCDTYSIVFTIPASVGQPAWIAYNSTNNSMYITLNNNTIRVIDCATNTETTIISVPLLLLIGIEYCPINNLIYVCSQTSGKVGIINCSNNTYVSSITVGVNPRFLAYNTLNDTMYVTNSGSNSVSVINCSTNLVVNTIAVGIQGFKISYNSINNSMYFTTNPSNLLGVIDCNNDTLATTITLPSLGYDVSFNSLLNAMYVTLASISQVSIIDCSTNTINSNLVAAGNTLAIEFNVTNNSFFITAFGGGTSTIISPSVFTTSYIGGSFNYNQFLRDIQNNPVLVKDVMFYSSNQSNVNQVFFTAIKDATGLTVLDPKYPQLSVSVNQMQNSISKVDFGDKGFVLDVTNSFSGVTVAAQSTLKLILVLKQEKKSYYLSGEDLCSKLENVNKVQYVMGVDNRNNVIHLPVLNFNTEKS